VGPGPPQALPIYCACLCLNADMSSLKHACLCFNGQPCMVVSLNFSLQGPDMVKAVPLQSAKQHSRLHRITFLTEVIVLLVLNNAVLPASQVSRATQFWLQSPCLGLPHHHSTLHTFPRQRLVPCNSSTAVQCCRPRDLQWHLDC